MPRARSVLLRHRILLAGLLFCALLVRALVPAGYMPVRVGGGLVLQLCPDAGPAVPVAAHMPGMHHGGGEPDRPAHAKQPCAFAGLVAPAIGAADPLVLAAALAFAFLLAIVGRAPALAHRRVRLRPPLRGPPLPA